jgi:hypothetical protein
MSDPFSSAGWFRHVKDTQRRRKATRKGKKSRGTENVTKRKTKAAGPMLALQQAEQLKQELGEAWIVDVTKDARVEIAETLPSSTTGNNA